MAAPWKQPRVMWEASSLSRISFDRRAGRYMPGTHAADTAAGVPLAYCALAADTSRSGKLQAILQRSIFYK
jgi:hypothetical protein